MRELYSFLGIRTKFTDWCNRIFEYGFTDRVDYIQIFDNSDVPKNENVKNLTSQQRSRMGIETDYAIRLEMAKEISMIQRNDITKFDYYNFKK